MRSIELVTRRLPVIALVAAAVATPVSARAQLAVQPANVRVLILPPYPANPADSTLAVQLGDAIRKRVDSKLRLKLQVVSKEKVGEALGSSGFPPDAILDDNGAIQLARFMNVDAYFWGTLERNTEAPSLRLRLVDNRRSGLAGWITVKGVAGDKVEDFASMVADSIDVQVKAAEQARECLDRRDRKDYGSAKERAARAFRLAPNHAQAAICVAMVNELTKSPLDSQKVAWEMATKGDPMLARAWDGLARIYQQLGDSLGWAEALIRNLESNPTDMRMRLAAVELLWRGKQFARSVQILDDGLARSPGDNGAIQFKARSCYDGQMWACSVEAHAERFEADTSVRNDSLYILKIIISASQQNDAATVGAAPDYAKKFFRAAPDNAAIEKWTGVAVQRFPNSISFWKARANALTTNGKTTEALAAWQRVMQLDPNDFPSRIQVGKALSERATAVFDSLGRIVDTLNARKDSIQLKRVKPTWDPVAAAAWAPADTVLNDALRLATGDTRVNVGALIFQPATKLVGKQIAPELAATMLEKALPLVASNQPLVTQANFFLGLAYLYRVQTLDFPAISKNKDCAAMGQLESWVAKGKTAITAGASIQPGTAQQLLGVFTNLEKTPPQAKKAWNCR